MGLFGFGKGKKADEILADLEAKAAEFVAIVKVAEGELLHDNFSYWNAEYLLRNYTHFKKTTRYWFGKQNPASPAFRTYLEQSATDKSSHKLFSAIDAEIYDYPLVDDLVPYFESDEKARGFIGELKVNLPEKFDKMPPLRRSLEAYEIYHERARRSFKDLVGSKASNYCNESRESISKVYNAFANLIPEIILECGLHRFQKENAKRVDPKTISYYYDEARNHLLLVASDERAFVCPSGLSPEAIKRQKDFFALLDWNLTLNPNLHDVSIVAARTQLLSRVPTLGDPKDILNSLSLEGMKAYPAVAEFFKTHSVFDRSFQTDWNAFRQEFEASFAAERDRIRKEQAQEERRIREEEFHAAYVSNRQELINRRWMEATSYIQSGEKNVYLYHFDTKFWLVFASDPHKADREMFAELAEGMVFHEDEENDTNRFTRKTIDMILETREYANHYFEEK